MDTTLSMVINIFGSFKEIIFYNKQQKVMTNFEKIDSALANLKGINMSYAYMPRFYIDFSDIDSRDSAKDMEKEIARLLFSQHYLYMG